MWIPTFRDENWSCYIDRSSLETSVLFRIDSVSLTAAFVYVRNYMEAVNKTPKDLLRSSMSICGKEKLIVRDIRQSLDVIFPVLEARVYAIRFKTSIFFHF